jgi:hypothetical protein
MKALVSLLISGALPLLAGEIYRHQDWRDVRPVIQSEVQRLDLTETEVLLRRFCTAGIRHEKFGLKCSTGDLDSAFSDIVDRQFHPQAVVYGHFLSATSEDAVVSGWSAETHPLLWGGTLLLTKRNGGWAPVWYKNSVITHSCEKVMTPGKRELLVCEDRDGGMGHILHYVYNVDLRKPTDRRTSPLVLADSFNNICVGRKQRITSLKWLERDFTLYVTIATPTWRRSARQICAGDPPDGPRPPRIGTLVYQLSDTGFRRVALR